MTKEKRILSYFIGWLILGLFICFVGISKTDALVINSSYLGQSANTNIGIESNSYKQANSYITVDQSNALNYYVVDICITSNFSISNVSNYSGNVSHYKTYTNLGSCNTTNYNGSLARIYFKVNQWADAGNGNYGITFGSRLNNTSNYYSDTRILNIYTSDEVDNTSELINNQTNELNNSINNSTNTITGSITDSQNNINQNIDDMQSAIVDSNKETQDVIKDQFNSCRDSVNLFNKNNITDGWIRASDNKIWNETGTFSYTDYINVKPNTTYTLNLYNVTSLSSAGIMEYDSNKSWLNIGLPETKKIITFTTSENTQYIRFTVRNEAINYIQLEEGSISTNYEPYGEEICSNKIDETNDKLDGIQGALTDSSTPNLSGLEDSIGWLPPGPVDSILNLPLTMLNSLTNSLTKTCTPLNLTLPYVNKNIQIPCLSAIFAQITGVNGLWTWVGTIASVLILYNYLLNLYAWVDRVLTLRAEFDEAMGADLANWGRL